MRECNALKKKKLVMGEVSEESLDEGKQNWDLGENYELTVRNLKRRCC